MTEGKKSLSGLSVGKEKQVIKQYEADVQTMAKMGYKPTNTALRSGQVKGGCLIVEGVGLGFRGNNH
jgi:hypothetical protein